MQKVINRLKTLQARLQGIYLEMTVLEQRTFLMRMTPIIKARILLGQHKFKDCADKLERIVGYLRESGTYYGKKYGESIRSKMRRIADSIEELIPSVQNSKSLDKIKKREDTELIQHYTMMYKLFYETANQLTFCSETDNADDLLDNSILLDIAETDLLLQDRIAESFVSKDWFTGEDISAALSDTLKLLLEAEAKLEDSAYKCKLYRTISIIEDFIGFVEGQIKSNK